MPAFFAQFINEYKKIATYIIIGLGTTFLTWLLWNLLILVFNHFGFFKTSVNFSAAQYLASFIMIYPSFYLNRIFTFKQHSDRHNNLYVTTGKAYLVYLISPLVASISTFLVLLIIPDILDFKLDFVQILPNIIQNLEFGKYSLQVFGLGIGMVINYGGQRFWIYS